MRGLSLHIGVNEVDPDHYHGWDGKLDACENDCDVMQSIAQCRKFETRQLKSAEATRGEVSGAIQKAATELVEGDIFLLSYSGHGGTIPDVDGDEEDLVDETWCLYDGQMLDDELAILWAGFKPGVRVLVVSDSCHSGTMLKGPGGSHGSHRLEPGGQFQTSRAMPREAARATARKNKAFYANLQYELPDPRPKIAATIRLLSGCQEDELSWESNGSGRFTAALRHSFADGQFEGDYKAFHQAILEQVKQKQTPNHNVRGVPSEEYDRQSPFEI